MHKGEENQRNQFIMLDSELTNTFWGFNLTGRIIHVKFHIRYLWDLIYTHTELNLTLYAITFYPLQKK